MRKVRTSALLYVCMMLLRLLLHPSVALAQQAPPADGSNIVPNPGFERFAGPPIGWSYKGSYFGQVVKYWFSATTASPDVYGPNVRVPSDWAAKGFGNQKPRNGNCMAGLTLYGCDEGKPHCREYIEIQLAEPLVVGQRYQVSFWLTPLERGLRINNIGAYVSVGRIDRKTDEVLLRDVVMQATDIVDTEKDKWVQVSGFFEAKYEAEYLLIGNFNEDKATKTLSTRIDAFNYAYYYIDDVLLKKVPPFIPPPVKSDDLTKIDITAGAIIRLKDIYFEFDRDELMPRSYVELHKLLKLLRKNAAMRIAIAGHTDNSGTDTYNLDLSRRRAKAVLDFLTDNGIDTERLKYSGEGERKPIATNDTDEGRQQNRRVEFMVLK
jgi:OmpA-OmpF porin, OOP family